MEHQKAILLDYQKKCNQVKKLQRKLKNKAKTTIRTQTLLDELEGRLARLKKEPIDAYDPIYIKELQDKKEAQIQELEHVIWVIKHQSREKGSSHYV